MSHEPLPPLRCESRRPRPPDGGASKWILALVVVSASMLDVLWLIPAQRAAERRQRAARIAAPQHLRWSGCPDARPAPPPRRATRVNDILLAVPPRPARSGDVVQPQRPSTPRADAPVLTR